MCAVADGKKSATYEMKFLNLLGVSMSTLTTSKTFGEQHFETSDSTLKGLLDTDYGFSDQRILSIGAPIRYIIRQKVDGFLKPLALDLAA